MPNYGTITPMYCKLFTSLYQGTLRGKSDEILVFTNLLAHCDAEGYVDKHWRAISEEVGLSEERVKAALLLLESPDPESRSPAEEGRRITRIDDHRAWGWQVTNYVKYRELKTLEDRRVQNREAQRRWREKHQNAEAEVSNGNQRKQSSATPSTSISYSPFSKGSMRGFDEFWKVYPKKKNKGDAEKAWKRLPDVLLTDILTAITRQCKTEQWQEAGGQYIPYPASWLNAKGWLDEVNVTVTSLKSPPKPTPFERSVAEAKAYLNGQTLDIQTRGQIEFLRQLSESAILAYFSESERGKIASILK